MEKNEEAINAVNEKIKTLKAFRREYAKIIAKYQSRINKYTTKISQLEKSKRRLENGESD